MSRHFYYDYLDTGAYLFSFTDESTYFIGQIKLPCQVSNCHSCGIDPALLCEKCTDIAPNNYFLRKDVTAN